jgi:hypothetical protein
MRAQAAPIPPPPPVMSADLLASRVMSYPYSGLMPFGLDDLAPAGNFDADPRRELLGGACDDFDSFFSSCCLIAGELRIMTISCCSGR